MENRIEQYCKATDNLSFTKEAKERMIENISKISTFETAGTRKKRFSIRKTVVLIAACVLVIGTVALATGKANKLSVSNRANSGTRDYEQLSRYEKEARMDIKAVESFSNGYIFQYMSTMDATSLDDIGNKYASAPAIKMHYTCKGKEDVDIIMTPLSLNREMYAESIADATQTKEIHGTEVYYSLEEWLYAPLDSLTDEEKAREKTDSHFHVKTGSAYDKRTTYFSAGAYFDIDDVIYSLATQTDMSADEIFEMAEEILTSGQ